MSHEADDEIEVTVVGAFDAATHRPFVVLTIGSEPTLLTPHKAALIGRWLIEAGTAAIGDAAALRVIDPAGTLSDVEQGRVLRQLRQLRAVVEET